MRHTFITTSRLLRTLVGLSVLLVMWTGCGAPPPDDDVTPDTSRQDTPRETADPALTPLEVSDEVIRGADGSVLIRIDDVPSSIRVDPEAEFGASGRFTDASLAPDEEWLALGTVGAAHSAGWLVQLGTEDTWPAAFQYGGDVRIGPWSDDGRYVVFIQEGPAPGRALSVVDRQNLGGTVTETAQDVRLPEETTPEAEPLTYDPVGWENGRLVFEVDGRRYRLAPESGEVEEER